MAARTADVVVPVYGDVELTRRCLLSVLTRSGDTLGELVVVEDRGPDAGMRPMLRALRTEWPAVRLLENEENLGFVGSANRGLLLGARDVAVLNSDTEVTEGWLEELVAVLDADPRIAAACPLSNHGHLCSVPEFNRPSPAAALRGQPLGTGALPRFTELPTGVGFCMLFRRSALDLLGAFDPRYGRGYNEENDWSQRARAAGYRLVRANRALVLHEGEVSFGGAREELDRYNARRLVGRYPAFLAHARDFDETADSTLAARAVRARSKPLRVCVDARGLAAERGTEATRALAAFLHALRDEEGLSVAVLGEGPQAEDLARAGLPLGGADALAEADVVHVFGGPASLADARSLVRSSAHLAVTFLDAVPFDVPAFDVDPERARACRAAATALALAGNVFAPTEAVKASLVAALALSADDVGVRPLGPSAQQLPSAAAAEAERRRLGLVRPSVVHLGGDGPWRGLPWLLEAWALAFPGGEGPELLLAGPECRLPGAAFFAGAVLPAGVRRLPDEGLEVAALLGGAAALADVSTVASVGFDRQLAQSLGVPVITSPPASPSALAARLVEVLAAARPVAQPLTPAERWVATYRALVSRPDEARLTRRRLVGELLVARW